MGLTTGTRLGPYEILSAIGAGGMGEVYKAKDTRLDRIVAIKVLPSHVSSDPAFRDRFEREARTIAALNHPHICTLHDVGHQDGIDFLVLEYLEGQTLADRLAKGALPLDQALAIAIEIADALDKAHRAGIVHRDLKPGNVMLTKSGAKLLDFGLAKMTPAVVAASGLSMAPTGVTPMTAQGTILGTLQYMAPEQLEGQQADARTDIFAFGAVAYEMVTGKKAFVGKSQASLIGAILKDDPPPMSSLQPMTPPNLDRVVQTCLEKDPDERWQIAQDLKKQLTWIAEATSQVRTLPAVPPSGIRVRRRSAFLWTLGFILLVVAGVAIWNLSTTRVTRPPPVSRFTITLPPGERFPVSSSDQVGSQSWLAISPDGRNLAYVATRGPGWQLYLRSMDSLESKLIPGTEQAVNPFFSPDGQWLGFMADGKLRKVSVSGGAAVTLADSAITSGASWGSLDGIVFVSQQSGVLQQVSDGGGAPRPLTRLEEGETAHSWPERLPDVGAVLFTRGTSTRPLVAVHSIESGQRKDLIPGATYPRYARSGHLLYAQGGTVMAVPFDQQRLQITGTAVPVLEGVLQRANGVAEFSVSTAGTLVYVPAGAEGIQRTLVWVSRTGAEQPVGAPPRSYDWPRLSPDGRRVAVEVADQLWLYDLDRGTLTRVTSDGGISISPAWTPDGTRIAFATESGMSWQRADGGGLEQLTSRAEFMHARQNPRSWSPDGQLLAFHGSTPTTGRDIWVLRLDDRKAQPFVRTSFAEGAPAFSPDGGWLAYVSNESGVPEVYVQPYPGPGGKRQISTDGGTEPVWNRNGRELFYRSGIKMMAVEVTTQPAFSAGRPRPLFEGRYLASVFPLIGVAYDVSPDGQRFLMIKEVEQSPSATQVVVVQNWFEELKRLVPTK